MKKAKKLLALLLAVLCISAAAMPTSADEVDQTTVSVRITDVNVAHNGAYRLLFKIATTISCPVAAIPGIIVWDTSVTEPTADNYDYAVFYKRKSSEHEYYRTREIAIDEIGNEFYVAACYRLGDELVIGQRPFKYSVAKYAAKRLGENVSAAQNDLYTAMLDLGGEGAMKSIAVKAVGGYVGYNESHIGGVAGQTVMLRADAKRGDGYFIKWVDEAGATVSNERITTVVAKTSGVSTYTAVFGDKDDSLYSDTYDFEALPLGHTDVEYPTQDSKYSQKGYNKAATPVWSKTHSYSDSFNVKSHIEMLTTTGGTAYGARDDFYVVEGEGGDKALYATKGHQIIGYTMAFSDLSDILAQGAEADITFHKITADGAGHHVSLVVTDANGKSVTLRNNLGYYASGKYFSISAEKGSNETTTAIINKVKFGMGQTLSFRAELNKETEALDIIINGSHLGSLPFTSYGAFADVADKIDISTLHISTINVMAISTCYADVTVDNITYILGEEPPAQDSDENLEVEQ